MVAVNSKTDSKPEDKSVGGSEKPNAFRVEPTVEPKAELPRDVALLDDEINRKVDPFYQTGTMDTSGTGGSVDNSVDAVSPIFRESRAWDMQTAARALDPDDDTPSELVVLPEGSVTVTGTSKTAEEGKADVFRALDKVSAEKNSAEKDPEK